MNFYVFSVSFILQFGRKSEKKEKIQLMKNKNHDN